MGRKSKAQLAEEKVIHSLTLYVVFSIFCILIYTIVEQVLSAVTGFSNDTLTTCFFAFFGGEIFLSAFIKISKLKTNKEGGIDDEMAG